MDRLNTFWADDAEFYHDKTGLMVGRFLHPYAQDHGVVGEAKFIHLWRYKEGAWKITRVISYDHGPAK